MKSEVVLDTALLFFYVSIRYLYKKKIENEIEYKRKRD